VIDSRVAQHLSDGTKGKQLNKHDQEIRTPNKKINPTGDKPVLIFKGSSPAGYLNRSPLAQRRIDFNL
jgi:hypothetical protein